MNPFDLWDQNTFTLLVREATDAALGNFSERIAGQFAQLVPTTDEKIARGRVKVRAVGKARGIVADDATPPIFRPKLRYTEEAFSLVRLTEMTPIEESLRRQLLLTGHDTESISIRDRAGADILTRTRAIAVRQELQSDWLIMQAMLNGSLTFKAANPPGQTTMDEVTIDYEYPTGSIGQAPTSFDNLASAKPVDVMRSLQEQLKAQTGKYGTRFRMSGDVLNYILTAADTVARFQWGGAVGQPPMVTTEMLKRLLHDPDNVELIVNDEGWFDEAAAYGSSEFGFLDSDKTRWIPKDTMVLEVPSPAADPFMTMYDGLVPVQTSWDDYVYRQGAQSYWQLLQGNLTRHARYECRRFPMIHHPERIVVWKVVF